jgi:molybdopterin molybdotransferase
MGRFDYIPQVLQELDVRVIFHKIAQRPGKPMWFGVGSGGQAVYALPGNPVSTLVCLTRYVLPGLQAAQGAAAVTNATSAATIALGESFEVKPALTLFMPVKILQDQASLRPTRGSGDFTSLIGTDGFVELPPGPKLYRW